MLVFTAALIIYVPALIAFYAPATECVFLSGHQPAAAAGPHAPPQPAMSVQFLTLTNAAFMVRPSVTPKGRLSDDHADGRGEGV